MFTFNLVIYALICNSVLLQRHKQVVKLLLENSADVNIQADDGCTAFDMASIIGKLRYTSIQISFLHPPLQRI